MLTDKNILVNGCSFSCGETSWPYHLQKMYEFNLVNLAQPAAGNLYIHNSTYTELSKRKYDFVFIMWSGIERVDFQVDDISLFDDISYTSQKTSMLNDWPKKVIFPLNDQDYVEKNWVFACNYEDEKLRKIKFCETNFKYQGTEIKAIQTLIYMISLQNILKQLNIPYVFSFYINYLASLKQYDLYKFLDLKNICVQDNIFSIALKNKQYDNTYHPTSNIHAMWAEILKNFIEENYAKAE